MTQKTLFSALVRGLYAVGKLDGEFLGELCSPIPPVPSRADWPVQGTLARPPAALIARAVEAVEASQAEIEEIRDWAQEDWTNDEHVSMTFAWLRDEQKELARAEAALADLLAA